MRDYQTWFCLLLLTLCGVMKASGLEADMSLEQREQTRETIDARGDEVLKRALTEYPELEAKLNSAAGWFAGEVSSAQLVVVGGGYGRGVAVNPENGQRTYLDVRRLDLGAGLGAGRAGMVLVFQTQEEFDSFTTGRWEWGLRGQSTAGTTGGSKGVSNQIDSVSSYFLSDGGASISVTLGLLRTRVNTELTDSGISPASIPNSGFFSTGQDPDEAPRQWGRALPFLAQQVIDEGYDLPLPYGFGLTYAWVEQDQLLAGLEVGFNGMTPEPYEFVSFENGVSKSSTASLKYDMWLFPFMNVYAMLGHVDGDAPLDVILDGNGMLEQLGTDCSGVIKPPLCRLLEDETFVLPVDAKFSGTTYGLGFTLAGGWNGWFVAIPFNWTYADMDTTTTDGVSTTVTPRGGRLIDLGSRGSLAWFLGANYLDTGLDINGALEIPGVDVILEYNVVQQNKDAWNGVLGFNWDFNQNVSWSLEYNGFFGSRDAWISSLVWRF